MLNGRPSAINVDSPIRDVHIASDNPVPNVRTLGLAPFVASQIVIVDVAMNTGVAVEAIVVHVPVHNVLVDSDIGVIIININIGDVNVRAASGHPTTSPPAMIINSVMTPIEVPIQPRPDRKSYAERNDRAAEIIPMANKHDSGIIRRNIDELRLNGHNLDIISRHNDLLLRVCHERACGVSHCPQPLDGRKDVVGLIDVGLA